MKKMNRFVLIGTSAALAVTLLLLTAVGRASTRALEQGPPVPTAAPASRSDPRAYLGTGKQLLDAVPAKSLSGDGPKKLTKLREDFEHLMATYESRAQPPSNDVVRWKQQFGEVERDLTSILGGGASLSVNSTTAVGTTAAVMSTAQPTGSDATATSPVGTGSPATQVAAFGTAAGTTTPGAAGSSTTLPTNRGAGGVDVDTNRAQRSTGPHSPGQGAAAVSEIGVKHLDPGVRTQLEQVRRNVELFYDATTGMGRTP